MNEIFIIFITLLQILKIYQFIVNNVFHWEKTNSKPIKIYELF